MAHHPEFFGPVFRISLENSTGASFSRLYSPNWRAPCALAPSPSRGGSACVRLAFPARHWVLFRHCGSTLRVDTAGRHRRREVDCVVAHVARFAFVSRSVACVRARTSAMQHISRKMLCASCRNYSSRGCRHVLIYRLQTMALHCMGFS